MKPRADPLPSRWFRDAFSTRRILRPTPELLVTLALLALIWISVHLVLQNNRAIAELTAAQETGNLSVAFSDSATRVVAGIDQQLLAIRAAYSVDPAGFNLENWSRGQNLLDPLTAHLSLIGPDGVLRDTLRASAGLDLSDREHFRVHLDPARDELFIGRPLLVSSTDVWTLQFTRKLVDPQRRFAGVVTYSLTCEELSRSYESVDVGRGFVMLAGLDGAVRAQAPMHPGALSLDLHRAPFFPQVEASLSGSYHALGSTDGIERVVSFRRLADYPLVVMVGFNEDRVLASYNAAWQRTVMFGTLVTFAVCLLGGLWIVQRRRSTASSRALQATLDHMSQGIVLLDGQGRVPVINNRAAELLDIPKGMLGRSRAGLSARLRAIGAAGEVEHGILHRLGRLIEVQASHLPRGGALLTYTDVTDRRRDEARIRHLAHHDGLTGLANRLLLNDRITEAGALGAPFALLALDLDGFKAVNDGLGHDVGDAVLVRAASRIQAAAGPGDTVARVGGDEFTVLIRKLADAAAADRLAARLVAVLAEPIVVGGHTCLIGASIGLILAESDDAPDASELLKKADVALYRAKCQGRGRFCRFDASMYQAMEERHWLERELRLGLEQDQMEVFFQPQFACSTGRITGFEALARWRHPERGLIPPGIFIPLAEECGLVLEIGRIVLEKACAEAAGWRPGCRVGVNLSPVQFRDTALIEFLTGVLARTGLPVHRLELEVTEGVLIGDEQQALRILQALQRLGVQLALDDFGTGYSSLSYLQRFSFDRVKIDKSFVQAQQTDKRARAILDAVLALSHNLGLVVTSEGVETPEQYLSLREQGCTEVQGFLLGRPMPADAVQLFIDANLSGTQPGLASIGEPAERLDA